MRHISPKPNRSRDASAPEPCRRRPAKREDREAGENQRGGAPVSQTVTPSSPIPIPNQRKIGSTTPTNAGMTSAPSGAALPCGAAVLSASHHSSHQRESSSLRLNFRPGFLGRGLTHD